jgi:hypothetical protein
METPQGAPRLRAMCDRYLAYLESAVFAGGCFWAATSVEFDGRPGPVRDRIAATLDVWLAALAKLAREAGTKDPEQLAFELHCIGQGANQRYQLGDAKAYARARAAFERLLP